MYLLSHIDQHPFITGKGDNANLKKIISISISPKDIIQLLTGRIPISHYDTAFISYTKESRKSLVLSYKNKITEMIVLDSQEQIQRIEVYTKNGDIAYDVEFLPSVPVLAFHLPQKFNISNTEGDSCSISIDKYVPNATYSPDIFVLKENGK